MINEYKKAMVLDAVRTGSLSPLTADGKCVVYKDAPPLCVDTDNEANWQRLFEAKFGGFSLPSLATVQDRRRRLERTSKEAKAYDHIDYLVQRDVDKSMVALTTGGGGLGIAILLATPFILGIGWALAEEWSEEAGQPRDDTNNIICDDFEWTTKCPELLTRKKTAEFTYDVFCEDRPVMKDLICREKIGIEGYYYYETLDKFYPLGSIEITSEPAAK